MQHYPRGFAPLADIAKELDTTESDLHHILTDVFHLAREADLKHVPTAKAFNGGYVTKYRYTIPARHRAAHTSILWHRKKLFTLLGLSPDKYQLINELESAPFDADENSQLINEFDLPDINDLAGLTHYIRAESNSSLYNELESNSVPAALPPAAHAAYKELIASESYKAAEPQVKGAEALPLAHNESFGAHCTQTVTGAVQALQTVQAPQISSGGPANSLMSSIIPPFNSITRIHAQVFRKVNKPSDKQRHGYRNVKLYVWTSHDVTECGDYRKATATVVFNLSSPAAFREAVRRNAKAGTITANRATELNALAQMQIDNAPLTLAGYSDEKSTMAYLRLKGPYSGAVGTHIIADQICILEWIREANELVPRLLIGLLNEPAVIDITGEPCKPKKDAQGNPLPLNPDAAEYYAYYDPIGYNDHRKKGGKRPRK